MRRNSGACGKLSLKRCDCSLQQPMNRRTFLSVGLAAAQPAQRRAERVILITVDGLRHQEVFQGIDPQLMNEKAAGMDRATALREALWRATPKERSEALMPFFWKRFVPRGVLFGNRSLNSRVETANRFRVSYPGYAEILTGRTQDDRIQGNTKIQNPTPTLLEFLRHRFGWERDEVALFASWETFRWIGESRPGAVRINAGYQREEGSPRARELSEFQLAARTPWDEVRHDLVTLELALDYMQRVRPRLLYIALGETDDWAHDRRYDRTLQAIQFFDLALDKVFALVDSLREFRERTAIFLTCDHGRGEGLAGWHSHGHQISGSEQCWLAALGPGIAAKGQLANTEPVYLQDLAPTILEILGVDYRQYPGIAGRPIAALFA